MNVLLLALGILSAFEGLASAQTPRIGAAGAVSGRVSASVPGAAERGISSGGDLFHQDSVQTDVRGRLQVLLLDETVFTIGPDSKIVLDEFAYDPFTDAGKVTAQVTKGVFRFVTGKVARKKPEGMKVKLPSGTVGIRGTIAGGRVEADGSALIALLGPGPDNNADERPGGMTVSNAGQSVDIDQPGYATRITSPDQPPTPPFPLTPEMLASLSAAPEPSAGGEDSSGGSSSASEESGQDTALAGESAAIELDAAEDENSLAETSNFAAQSLSGSGAFSWEDLRNALASGTAFYDGQGTYSCSGTGACSAPGSGLFALHFNVNFGARTLGGPSPSTSHFAFVSGPLLGSPEQPSSNIPSISFSSLSGDAKLTQGVDFSGSNSNFNGSSFKFTDARTVSGTLQYSAAGDTATGTVTSPCVSGSCPP